MIDISELIQLALNEDRGSGDHTSLACVPSNAIGKAKLLVKEDGIIAGVEIARQVFKRVDPQLKIDVKINDGELVKRGDIIFYVSGKSQSILLAERLVLNYMQRMSGIASYTNKLVKLIAHTNCKILDTRKTTPNNRIFEKLAVKIGGGYNHRFGLYDLIMIKDNHIDYAGGISNAVAQTKEYIQENNLDIEVEIEARNLDEVNQIIAIGNVDRIMLDNFNFEDLKSAVELIGNTAITEASGGINEDTIVAYANCGVDYISVGALTHQINSLDLSLKAILNE